MCINLPITVRRSKQAGFSLVETVIVVGIVLVATAAAVINLVPPIKTSRSNAAMELVLGELRRAHERAVDERRIYRVTFTAPGTIQLDVGKVAGYGPTLSQSSPPCATSHTPPTPPSGGPSA